MDEKLLTFVPKMHFPRELYLGPKSTTYFKALGSVKKLFLVSRTFREKNGALVQTLTGTDTVIEHSGEPLSTDVAAVRSACEQSQCQYLVAIGGGSVIDLAKIVKRDLGISLIAVPTTMGSGSEVSQFAPVIDTTTHRKTVTISVQLLPEVVIIHPEFLQSLSREQVIYQSLDALAHGLESLVSRLASSMSDAYALMSIERIYTLLAAFAGGRDDALLREQLKVATTLAGLAQSSAATGLIHSFGHVIGGQYGIPHAQAISMFLMDVLPLNVAHTDKYAKLNVLRDVSAETFVEKLGTILTSCALPRRVLAISDEQLPTTAEAIRKDICTMSNPYAPTSEDITAILRRHV